MIRIGDFSKLSRVSIKTLRYYDEVGLLKPVHVDRFTSYRYYDYHQLSRLYRILALKDLGFALEDISRLLAGNLAVGQMQAMVQLRQAEIRQRMVEELERLARVEILLRQIEQGEIMSNYDIVIKQIEPVLVASVRDVVPTPPEQYSLWGELMAYLEGNSAYMSGPPMALYHDAEAPEQGWDIEVCMPIVGLVPGTKRINVHTLPGIAMMACVVHNGPFATIGQAYDALARWIDEHGYRIVGPGRELNLRVPDPPNNQNDPNAVNEIQFPIEKV